MRRPRLLSLAAAAALLGASVAQAEEYFQVSDAGDANVAAISYEEGDAVLPAATAPDCGCDDACADACGNYDTCCSFCDRLEAMSLANILGTTDTQWEIGGFTQVGYHSDNQPLSQSFDDLLSFNDVPDRVRLQQQWMYFGRKANGECGWDIGGRVDVLYGTDAQKTQSFGNPGAGVRNQGSFDASWDHGIYGFAIPQAYVEVASGDLSVKLGHFFTILGYEVIPSNGNFFYSHSYMMFNNEPFTHTGALATYTGFEDWTLYGGWVLGWDTGFDQLNSGSAFLGGASRKLGDCATFTYATTYGNFGWRDGGNASGNPSYVHSAVLDVNVTERLKYVLQNDYIRTDNSPISTFDGFGFNNYLIYSLNDKIGIGARQEWWKADGISFNAITAGVNIKPCANFVLRPEVRKDWAPGIGMDEDVNFAMDAILTY